MLGLVASKSWTHLAWVVQKVDNAIHRINHYPADRVVCFVDTCPMNSNKLMDLVLFNLASNQACNVFQDGLSLGTSLILILLTLLLP